MKKILVLFFITTLTTVLHAQQSDSLNYYKNLETTQELKLTSKQIMEIKKLKREAGSKFAAIGKDRTLSGYEKGQKKRELAIQLRENIQKILTTDQVNLWEQKYGKIKYGQGVKNTAADNIDDLLDSLEDKYEAEIKSIENNASLSNDQKKSQKKVLKENYKKEKNELKKKKEEIKDIF